MTEHEIMQEARIAFDAYAGSDVPPSMTSDVFIELVTLQARLAAWQANHFGAQPLVNQVLGVCEEAGELAHAALKHVQGIRGLKDPDALRAKASDALADLLVYSMQVATILRLDLLTTLVLTAREVMKRDWARDPANGGMRAQVAQPDDRKDGGDEDDEEEAEEEGRAS